jgi:hypothetical protein
MSAARSFVLALVMLGAASARADDWPFNSNHTGGSSQAGCTVGCGVMFGLTFGLDLVVDIVDVVVLAQRDFISPGWSVVQGLWGVGHVVVGAVVTAVGGLAVGLGAAGAGAFLALGLVVLGEGILLIVVAIISTVRYFTARRHPPEAARDPLIPALAVSVDGQGGVSSLLSWQF